MTRFNIRKLTLPAVGATLLCFGLSAQPDQVPQSTVPRQPVVTPFSPAMQDIPPDQQQQLNEQAKPATVPDQPITEPLPVSDMPATDPSSMTAPVPVPNPAPVTDQPRDEIEQGIAAAQDGTAVADQDRKDKDTSTTMTDQSQPDQVQPAQSTDSEAATPTSTSSSDINNDSDNDKLPKTGSEMPLIAAFGTSSLGLAGVLRLLRRRS